MQPALAVIGVLFIAIILLANLLLRGAQLDLTDGKLYTLSDGTKHIVSDLKEPVNLYLFFSENAATQIPEIRNLRRARAGVARTAGLALQRQAHAQGHRPAALLRGGGPRHRARHQLGADQRQRRKTVPGTGRHQFHRRQGIHLLPGSRARRAARVRRGQAHLQAVERQEAGDRLVVVAAHVRRLRHADRPAASAMGRVWPARTAVHRARRSNPR